MIVASAAAGQNSAVNARLDCGDVQRLPLFAQSAWADSWAVSTSKSSCGEIHLSNREIRFNPSSPSTYRLALGVPDYF